MKKIKPLILISAVTFLWLSACSFNSDGGSNNANTSSGLSKVKYKAGDIAKNSLVIDGIALGKTAEVYVMDWNKTSYEIEGKKNSNNPVGVFVTGRTVTLSSFIIGKYEVTQELYAAVMKDQKVSVGGTEYALSDNPSFCTEGSTEYAVADAGEQKYRPVEGVSWFDSVYFCNVLSEKTGLTPAYVIDIKTVSDKHITKADVTPVEGANGYRLPTEAEWEFAARGGNTESEAWDYTFSGASSGKKYVSGSSSVLSDDALDTVGWYTYNNKTGTTGNSTAIASAAGKGTHEVGKKASNTLGLYDMSGNVWEWCYDFYGQIKTGTEENPIGASSGNSRVIRGGCWMREANRATVCYRNSDTGAGRWDRLGFRLVRNKK